MKTLLPFSLPGTFRRGNLHTHSTLSDGRLEPGEVVEKYQQAGYDFLVLSEHFLECYQWPVADVSMYSGEDFATLVGAELHAPKTSAGELWHILATGLPKTFLPAAHNETAVQLAERASLAGAFVSIAHPCWSQLSIEDGLSIESADAVEIYNHGCEVECDRGDGWYLLDQLNNDGRRLNAIACDDAHFITGDRDAFGGWVNVKTQCLNADELLVALKAGHYYSTQGPQINSINVNDLKLTVHCSPVDLIAVVSGTSRTVTQAGDAISESCLDLENLKNGWFLEKPSDWFRVVIRDACGRRAWTNPYWFDDL